MSIHEILKNRIRIRADHFHQLKTGKESLLQILDETEISESVYNSNAIENSTLTLPETEKILLELSVSRDVSVREVFETKNLARVMEYIAKIAPEKKLDKETLLFLHKMLLTGINDDIAGRFRATGEYVRVGNYVAPAPEHTESMITSLLNTYGQDLSSHFLEKIARFHLQFETIHPFVDGNGRIGRVLINYQLTHVGLPNIIIRDKEKIDYYASFKNYQRGNTDDISAMEKIIAYALLESLHRRIAYLEGNKIITVTEYAEQEGINSNTALNAAKRQSIPAFREKGRWMIGV